ncbi:MAG: ABC transporter permease [Treponemataceae bacterium]
MKNYKLSNIMFISRRLNKTGITGREAIINLLSVLGIAFGVIALIVILAVMNGFQSGFINTIMEVSSGHIHLSGSYDDLKKANTKINKKSFFIFNESQALAQGNHNRQAGTLVRAVELEDFLQDEGLVEHLYFVDGSLNLEKDGTVILGYQLAKSLNAHVGDTVFLPILAGSGETNIFSEDSELLVTGIFKTGFLGVDSSFSFVSFQTGEKLFGKASTLKAFVKLKKENDDYKYIAEIKKSFPKIEAESWRSYNHAFFGALRVEKNVMMILVVLIFFVVAVNIYNGMRRNIYERREDIAVLASLGMKKNTLRFLFFLNGFKIGLIGSVAGLLIGLAMSKNINEIFGIVENIINFFMAVFAHIFYSRDQIHMMDSFSIFSQKVFYMDTVPSAISFFECCYISLFGLVSASLAALIATKKILSLKPQEILQYE